MPSNFRRSIHLTVAVLAFSIALVSSFVRSYVWQRMADSVERTIQAAEIDTMLDQQFLLLVSAETGQRGFLLTGDRSYLAPYEHAERELANHTAVLDRALATRPAAAGIFADWKKAANEKMDELRDTIKAHDEGGISSALARVNAEPGKVLMEKVMNLHDQIKVITSADLGHANAQRRERMNIAMSWTTAAGVSGVVAGLVALSMFTQAQRLAAGEEIQSRRAELAEEVGKQKSAFLANMSHEIRTPMNAVLGFAELMETEPMTEKQRGHLHSIKQAGQSLVQLINDILDISKVEAGMVELHPHPTDIREAYEFVRTVVGQVCVKKGVDLRIDVPRSIPRSLLLDEGRLRQILVNLAGNAARFTDHGFVRVAASAEYSPEDRARLTLSLSVQDTGIGIPREKHGVIFNAFVQADSRRHVDKQGTGLGLSIVKRLTELMDGKVSVISEPGRGSTFTVIIPNVEIAAQLPESELTAADARISLDDFSPSEILVVDDNPVNRELLAGIFEGTHHHVRFAANGLEALNAMTEKKPGLVLMDVRMPVMTGTEAVQQMRTQPQLKSVPVIAVTASSLLTEEGNVRRNFSGYLRKPFSRVELYQQISRFLPQGTRSSSVMLPVLSAMEFPSAEHVPGWTGAIIKLRQMESSSWPALQKTLAITEAKGFAVRLLAIADAAECPPLRTYAEELRRHADNFAADDLERHLAAFPLFIALLEERISQSQSHASE
jgi:signal transduction histidine kinase/CheY-like chemotaxis protein